MSKATDDVLAERERQVAELGWTAEHDDDHVDGSLASAAACYATPAPRMKTIKETRDDSGGRGECPVWRQMPFRVPCGWPVSWSGEWWKPKDRRRDLVRAAALLIAEIERLDRYAAR